MSDEIQVWKCKNGHGLGIVQHDGQKVGRLLLYRHAVDMEEQAPAEVDLIAVIESAVDIKCDICNSARTWAPNQVAFDKLWNNRFHSATIIERINSNT